MRHLSGHHRDRCATSSTPPTTQSNITVHSSHESDAPIYLDVFSHVESGFNHFRSVIHDPSARIAALSVVDEEVRASMRLLRSLCNALAPIALLPSEVLTRVFHFLSLEEPPCSGGQNLAWIRVTHVCRFWRQVALGDLSLWARISGVPTNTQLISEMLARARNMPLDIHTYLDGMSSPEVLLAIFSSHLFHTRELRLQFGSMLPSADFQNICSQEAPTLEHFELHSIHFPIILQELTLFNGKAPRLRTFSLFLVFIPWSLIPRGQLTQLKVSFINEVSLSAPKGGDLNRLIDLLVNCPELEVLVLKGSLPFQLSHFPHDRTIHLPRLARLELAGSSSRVTNFFKMLKIPSSVTLHLRCSSGYASIHNDYHLFPVVSAYLQSPSPVEFKNLCVTFSDRDRSLDVIASTSLPTLGSRRSDDEFVLSFDWLPEFGNWTELLEQTCKMLPISNLEFLSISAPDIVNPINWVELFKRCTKVTAMQATGCRTSGLVRALTTPKVTNTRRGWKGKKTGQDNSDGTSAQSARSTVSRAQATIFPNLTSLSLKRLNFAERVHSSGILFNVVKKGLRQRKAAYNTPLKMLRIDDCAISAERAKALQGLVQTFHWDGNESFFDKSEGFCHRSADSDKSA